MDAGFVIVSVLVALFAIWGVFMLWRAVFEWLFAPRQVRGAVVVGCAKDLENLDFLLVEAEKNCMCHRESPTVVILMPDMLSVWLEMENAARLCHDIPPSLVLSCHHAVVVVGDFLEV